MSLSAGTHLGPYEILAPLGAGGMGEVYRARDTKLDREVAIKVLPEALAQDPERMARFEREAKVLASLNHPNIAQIYGIEERALVMELVEGETLAEEIKQAPLPVETALNYAKQIAEALEAAHERGIIHRDLKPSNVMITRAGAVKVLDFGLAAQSREHESEATLTMSPTRAGMIMGTVAYMSPEQARGQPVDRRADIWAFGAVLYEMLTGKQAFTGETASDILAAVLTKEPDLEAIPLRARKLVARCLTKDRKMRLQAIGDWRLFADEVGQAHFEAGGGLPDAQVRNPRHSRVAWGVAGVMTVALAAALVALWPRTIDHPLVRLDVDLGPDVSLQSNQSISGASTILSPDGTRLAYVSQNRLFTRRLDQSKATELAGTEGAYEPFFSPDGQWVAFFAAVKLKKISVEGGSAIALCDVAGGSGLGGSWGADGNIVAALNSAGALSRIPSSGGTPAQVTELAQGEVTHRWPQILPGGKAVLFTAHAAVLGGFDGANIEVMSLGDHRRKTLLRGGTFGRYLPSGHLIYVNRSTLFAVPFDLERLEVRGTPAPVLDEVAYSTTSGSAQFDFSRSGTLVYESGGAVGAGLFTAQWLDGAGRAQPLLAKADNYLAPRLSPDGTRLAVSAADIWIYDWQRDTMTRLTFSGAASPVWSPDGRYIVFRGPGGLFWTRSDGAGKPQPLTQSKVPQTPYSFSPDGKRLAFHEIVGPGFQLWTVPVESDGTGLRAGKPEPFLQTQFSERSPSFSPDGRWLAYASDESGAYQVYVRAFPDKGGKWQVSNSGGVYPVFSRNGRELFFRTEDNRIMVAAYTGTGDSFAADKPRVWSEKKIADSGLTGINYDVAPDGKRIAALMPAEAPEAQKAQNHVIFLENFFDELRRRVKP